MFPVQPLRMLAPVCLLLLAALSPIWATPTNNNDNINNNLGGAARRMMSSKLTESMVEKLQRRFSERHMTTTATFSTQRELAAEDFDEFRDLIRQAVIRLPNFETVETILFFDLVLRASNVQCYDVQMGDLQISYALESNQRLSFRMDVLDLDLICTLDYRWEYGFASGDGSALIVLDNNSAGTEVAFMSENFDLYPPANSTVESCNADISITDMDFSGGITESILNVFEGLLRGFVESATSETICTELGSLGTTLVSEFLDEARETLEPYLQPLPVSALDAVQVEQSLIVPPDVALMNFQNANTSDASSEALWFYNALKEVDSALGVWLIDPNGPRAEGKDLGVNIALRENVLDKDRALTLKVADLPFDFDPVLFSGHDSLTETTITLDAVTIHGLDTFNHFAPFINQGKYTLQNELRWDYLVFEAQVTMNIKPSTLEDSVILDPNQNMAIEEKVKIKFGVDDIDAVISLVLAIDQDKFGQLKVGPLLFDTNLLPCFMSTVFHSEITVFRANVGNIREPTLEGFISAGIDNLVTQSVKAAFLMYESVVIRAIPNIFQVSLREVINESFFRKYVGVCPEPLQMDGWLDFRDLFLDGEEAKAMGASGTEPYGNIASQLFSFLKTQVATVNDDGTLTANDMLIRPVTRGQSGVKGMVHFPGELVRVAAESFDLGGFDTMLQDFVFGMSNIKAQNLDVMVPPFKFFEPNADPQALDNSLQFGPVPNRALNVSVDLWLRIAEDSPLAMQNEVELSMSTSSFQMVAEILARVETMGLLNFPLHDLLNYHCWLSTIPPPAMAEGGLRLDPNEQRGLDLKHFVNRFVDLEIGVKCKNCTSLGMGLLPEMLQMMRETNVSSTLATRMKTAVDDIVMSDMAQAQIDRLLLEAPYMCPHRPEFDKELDTELHADLPLPELSAESLDSVQFSLAVAAEIGYVLLSHSHSLKEVNPADTLDEQNKFVVPPGSNLLNFSDFELELPYFLDSGLKQLRNSISGSRIDGMTGKEDLGINIFVRDMVGESGILNWAFDDITFGSENFMFALHSLKIEGLDSFTEFTLLEPVAPQTLLNNFAMEKLFIEIDFSLSSPLASRRLQMGFKIDGVNASLPLFAAIDRDLIKTLQVGSLLHITNLVPCFMSAVYGFKFPYMLVNFTKVDKLFVHGLMNETNAAFTRLVDTVFDQYRDTMLKAVPSIFHNSIRVMLNNMFAAFMAGESKSCTNPILESLASARKLLEAAAAPFIDFRDLLLPEDKAIELGGTGDWRYGDLIRTVWGLIEQEVLGSASEESSTYAINDNVIGPLAEGMGGEDGNIFLEGDLLNEQTRISIGGLDAGIAFRISNASFENLNTVGAPFSLLDPVKDQPNILNNTATIGVAEPLRVGARLLLFIETGETTIKNDFKFSADLRSVTMLLTALLKVSEYRFAAFPVGDIFNVDCWLATLPPPALDVYGIRKDGVEPSAAMEELVVSMQQLSLNIECIECTSPGLQEMAEKWSMPEATAEMTTAANELLSYAAELLSSGLVQNEIDRTLNDASKRCPHSPQYQQDFTAVTYQSFRLEEEEFGMSLAVMLMIVIGCLCAIVAVVVFTLRCFVRRRHGKWLQTLPREQLLLLQQFQMKAEEKESDLNAMTKSMFTSAKDIPLAVRLLIPLVIVGNIGFFLSGHLSLGAEVHIVASFAGQTLKVNKFYAFSMAQSTVEIWEAGGKELAILILLFSGVWPYTKQLITLVLWFLPPTRCSVSRRGSILLWLDILAKWSIVDIFTLVMSVVAFRVSIESPKLGFIPDDFYSIDLMVVPMWGLYANLIAQLISQVSSHFIIHYHRKILYSATKAYMHKHGFLPPSAMTETSEDSSGSAEKWNPYGDKKEVLYKHTYARPHRGESEHLVLRRWVNFVVGFVAVGVCVFIILGTALPSVGLEFFGMLGIAVEVGQNGERAYTEFSVFDLVRSLMDQAAFVGDASSSFGLGTLCALVVITVLIVPIVQAATLVYQWFVPMSGRKREKVSIAVEVLQAWQYAEVYIISVIVASWQLGPISTFMLNYMCESFQETFDMLAYFNVIEDNDAQCFQIDPTIKGAAYILGAGAVCLSILNSFVGNAAVQYFRDRDEANEREFGWKKESIVRSMSQSIHETPSTIRSPRGVESGSAVDSIDEMFGNNAYATDAHRAKAFKDERKAAMNYIRPAPVLFTDKYRWFLCRGEYNEFDEFTTEQAPRHEVTDEHIQSESDDEEQPSTPVLAVDSPRKESLMGDMCDAVGNVCAVNATDNVAS